MLFCKHNVVIMLQLRLDFNNFVITGPSMETISTTKRVKNGGVVQNGATVPVTEATQCLTDRFSVSNADGPNPPVICGTNTGEHSKEHYVF